jgi:hypothetical protein
MYDCAFEIIAVRGWLGRYTLMAGVMSAGDGKPPEFLLLKHVLSPSDYGLEGMPEPPDGICLASVARTRRSDVPIDTGDFETASLTDDDVPF